jgi:hypothetical protein
MLNRRGENLLGTGLGDGNPDKGGSQGWHLTRNCVNGSERFRPN